MKPERWQQVDKLLQAALALDPEDRAPFLDHACKSDAALRREIDSLLEAHESAGSFISSPALEASPSLINDSIIERKIGHYRVMAQLGAGGMGEVYLAQDARLGRKVALKMLPGYFTSDEQRVKRFKQEAQTASALNHPNIITIYDIGEVDGRHFIAMEYVEGETLGEKIHHNHTPLHELLKYLQHVAEGLTKAHAAGIIHRDLKPENIMVTRDGHAKVLDFGLAKLVEQPKPNAAGDADASEVETALLRQHSLSGMVMGTVGYMSPEQALGRVKDIDHRSDIFSFGCILYEAATGRRAFNGKDVLDSLHKIVHAETPQIKEANPRAPDDLERVVRRCLAKDPEKRYQSIKDVAIELEDIHQVLKHSAPIASAIAAAPTGEVTARQTSSAEYLVGQIKRHKTATTLIAATLIIALAGLGFLLFRPWQSTTSGSQTAANTPAPFQTMKLTRLTTSGKATDATISPDGKYVAYINNDGGQQSIWIRHVATSSNVKIVEPEQRLLQGMTFSPDGNYLYFRIREEASVVSSLFRVPVLGGDARRVIVGLYSPAAFSPDGKQLAFVRNNSPVLGKSNLIIANADGSDERIISSHDLAEAFALPGWPIAPTWSPDGRVIACAHGRYPSTLIEMNVESGDEKPIGPQNWRYIDHLSWLSDGSALLLTATDDKSSQAQVWYVAYPSGEARRVTNDLNTYRGMSLTADSKMAAVIQIATDSNIWIAPRGKADEARRITSGADINDGNFGLAWTPDGKLIYTSNASGTWGLWSMNAEGGGQKQLTTATHRDIYPMVTHDGRYIIFSSDRGGTPDLWRVEMDGSNPKQLTSGKRFFQGLSLSPDNKWIIFSTAGRMGTGAFALWKVGIDGETPAQLTDNTYWVELPAVSPDAKQIACQYLERGKPPMIGLLPIEGGQITVIARPSQRLSGRLQWMADGSAIAYIDERDGVSNIWIVPVGGGAPRQLTDFKADRIFWFDWSPDGKRLALARGTQVTDVVLISNFR